MKRDRITSIPNLFSFLLGLTFFSSMHIYSKASHTLELDGNTGWIESVSGKAKIDEDFLTIGKLLCNNTRGSQHG